MSDNSENPNQDKIDILNTVQPRGQVQNLAQDIYNYTPQGLDPSQFQAYQASVQPTTGGLPVNAYYPDIGHNIGVGNYSGSEIGSATLFAPGGGLVPLGMLDARDAAASHAALRKQKIEDDFRKQFQSPSTKHVAVQKSLSDAYNSGLQQWYKNALKKSGGDSAIAHRILQLDPNFNAWDKSMQDMAKYHDAIVEHAAQLHADEKDPNFVLSPETKKTTQDLLSGVAYQGMDPFSRDAQNIGGKYLAATANYDVDKSVNNAIDKAIPTIEQLAPTFQGRGKNEIATYLEKEYFTPDARKELAHNLYMEKYQGTGITEDQVQKNVDAKLGEKIRRKTDSYDKYFKPEKTEPDYSNVSETTARFNVDTGKGVEEAHVQSFIPLTATHEKQEISFPINKGTKDLGAAELHDKTGSFKGTVSGFGIAYVDRVTGKVSTISPEEAAIQKKNHTFNHNLEATPVALVNKKGSVAALPAAQLKQLQEPLQVSDGEGGTRSETEEETQQRVNAFIAEHNSDQEGKLNKLVPVPIEEVEGKYPKKNGQKVSADDKIKEVKQKALSINEEYKKSVRSTSKEIPSKKGSDLEALRKKYNY